MASPFQTPAPRKNDVHNIALSIRGTMPPNTVDPLSSQDPASQYSQRPATTALDEADTYLMRQMSKGHIFWSFYDDSDPINAVRESDSESVARRITWKILTNAMSNSKDLIDKIVIGDCRAL